MKFRIKSPPPSKPDGVLSLEEKDGYVVLLLKVGESANTTIATFGDYGQVYIERYRMEKFGLQIHIQ